MKKGRGTSTRNGPSSDADSGDAGTERGKKFCEETAARGTVKIKNSKGAHLEERGGKLFIEGQTKKDMAKETETAKHGIICHPPQEEGI